MMSNENSRADFLIYGLSLAMISAFFFLHSAGTSDIFWQMKTGEILWGTKGFLRLDPFSFTFSGSAWANFEWLSEIIFYFVRRAGGFAALSVLSFSAGLGIAAALFFAFSKLSGFRYLPLILIFAVFIIGAPRFAQLRPELFGFLFFALVIFLLVSARENSARRVWLCIPILALWANLHASAIVGVLLIATYIGSQFFSRRPKMSEIMGTSKNLKFHRLSFPHEVSGNPVQRCLRVCLRTGSPTEACPRMIVSGALGDDRPKKQVFRGALMFVALCFLAPLANPLGTAIYSLPLQILSQSYAMSVTSDWAAPAWFSGEISFSAWGLFLLVSTSVAIMTVRRRIHIPTVVTACIFTIPAVFVSRFIPFSAISWGCVFAYAASGNDDPRGKPRGIRCILPLEGGGYLLASSGETRLRAGGEGDHCHPEKGRGPIGALRPLPIPLPRKVAWPQRGFTPSRERERAVTPPHQPEADPPLAEAAGNHLVEKNVRAALCAAVLAVCVGVPVFFFRAGVPFGARETDERIEFIFGPPVGASFDGADFPVDAANFLEEIGYRGNIFNDMAWGGYLIWRLYPEQKVFIDTRTHLYGDRFIREYADALFNKDAFAMTAKKYNIGCVIYDARQILSGGGPLQFLFGDPKWRVMPRMGNAFIFMKKSSHSD